MFNYERCDDVIRLMECMAPVVEVEKLKV